MKKQNHKAFTLVELIVVITILAILGTIAFISLEGYSKNSRDGVRIADINSARKSLELYITEKGTYPIPDTASNITYSGGIAWIEGTIGDGVIRNLDKINKKLLDPLTGNEYTYSITASKTEYQIGAISEGGTISQNLPINKTHAATDKKATAMIRGTYNERFLKVQSGTINRILAIPSIIATDITQTDVQTILDNSKLVYNNYQNIPHSYNNAGYTMTGGFNYTKPNPQIYSGSLKSLTESNTGKLDFITNLKTAYNGTILHGEPNYKEIINSDTTNNSTGAINTVISFINSNVGGLKVSNTVLPMLSINGTTEEPETPQTYTCTGELEIANADITNTGGLTVDTIYQDDNSSNSCYYTCKANYSGTNCETYTEPITGWRLLDSNCQVNDIVVGTQTWAGCNSTLGTGFEWGKQNNGTNGTIGGCYNYDGTNNIANCVIGATNMASNTSAITFFNAMQPDGTNVNGDAEVNNIWGKLYTWSNAVQANNACPTGWHLPSDAEWSILEQSLGCLASEATRVTRGCDGLGWKSNISYNPDRKLAETLKIPLAGFRSTDGSYFVNRGFTTYMWSSTTNDSNVYYRLLYRDKSSVQRNLSSQLQGFSVRCIKD